MRERLVALAHAPRVRVGHRLPPRLGEAFGGSTGLVDVVVRRDPLDHATHPYADHSLAPMNVTTSSSRMAALEHYCKDDSVAEVECLLQPDLKLLESGGPLLQEAA